MKSSGQGRVRPQNETKKNKGMITRSNLVEQLREYQIRSQHQWASLSFFSATAQINSRTDAATAFLWLSLFIVLVTLSVVALYLRHTKVAIGMACLANLLLVGLKIVRKVQLARKRQRRMLLPLSM